MTMWMTIIATFRFGSHRFLDIVPTSGINISQKNFIFQGSSLQGEPNTSFNLMSEAWKPNCEKFAKLGYVKNIRCNIYVKCNKYASRVQFTGKIFIEDNCQ